MIGRYRLSLSGYTYEEWDKEENDEHYGERIVAINVDDEDLNAAYGKLVQRLKELKEAL